MEAKLSFRALALLLCLNAPLATSEEIPVSSDPHTICMGLECTDGRRARSEVQVPDAGDTEIPVYAGSCPRGLPLAQPMKTLPRGHAFIGKDQKQVILELKDPERDLLNGDILLSSYGDDALRASPAAQFFDGSGHAALVGTVNGKKFHLDSPWEMSGRCELPEFREHGWTVLRMRRYPVGVNTPADLEKIQKEHPEKLEAWTKYRAAVLKRVNEYFEAMRRSPFDYNSNYLDTKVFDKKTREAWRTQLFPKEGASKCPVNSVYCSELPTTGFALADEDIAGKMPQGLALLNAINSFESEILKKELGDKKLDSPDGEKAFDKAWDKLVSDVGEGRNELMQNFRQQQDKIKKAVRGLLSIPREMRPTGLALLTTQMPGLPVSPTDLYHDIFRENGLFSYAGTFVGKDCVPVKKIVASGQPKAGEFRTLESKLVKDPGRLPEDLPQRIPALEALPERLPAVAREHNQRPRARDPQAAQATNGLGVANPVERPRQGEFRKADRERFFKLMEIDESTLQPAKK